MSLQFFRTFGHFSGRFYGKNLIQSIGQSQKPTIGHFCKRWLNYTQGQTPIKGHREYFYYIDHQGMLFLDDSKMKNFTSCIKDKKFLHFFFTRIRPNTTARYESEFPFVSFCGRERNYIRCDDTPAVFSHVFTINGTGSNSVSTNVSNNLNKFAFGNAGDLLFHDFEPEHICMVPETGRLYHPAHEFYGGFGLIKSSLAIEISHSFVYENDEEDNLISDELINEKLISNSGLISERKKFPQPTHFIFEGVKYKLSNLLLDLIYS